MKKRKYRCFACDFETTVYDGQESTEVWASASVELFTEDVQIFHSIEEQYDYFHTLNENIYCYYHNLKFDGAFWLYFLMFNLKYKQAFSNETNDWLAIKDMPIKSFRYSISEMGQWYNIIIKTSNRKIIEIRDSLKLLPFSLGKIGESFGTKHKKLTMEYTGFRYAGCKITSEEKEYIANDVLVLKEALEITFTEGHDKLTIGSCCLEEYKKSLFEEEYRDYFPNIYDIKIDKTIYGEENAGEYVRNSYKGGWCYVVKGKENKIFNNGSTLDVNSLYPSMMHSESGNVYPIGKPTFWTGNYIPIECKLGKYYFIRIKTRFKIKPNKLPFIQIKHSYRYRANEYLETSDYYDKTKNKWYRYYIGADGEKHDTTVTLTLTCTDYNLLLSHYDLIDCEILDGCFFNTAKGIFDDYINKYKKIKIESKGAKRELAKLFLNNLYGKMASNTSSSFKVAFEKEGGVLGYRLVEQNNKKPGYIPVGSAITSYARNFTITAAQNNYYGPNKRGFIYADTDSIHCDLKPEELKGIKTHDVDFCCWKVESEWDIAIFTRQKTYIEHTAKGYDIKCAGMPDKCKKLFELSIKDEYSEEDKKYVKELDEDKQKFVKTKRTINDFNIGLCIPGKLIPKNIPGGVLLTETTYEMR